MKADYSIAFIFAGLAVGAVVVYIYLTTTMGTSVTDITRDSEGRIISIVEKKL